MHQRNNALDLQIAYMPRCEAPWPKGYKAKWWTNEVMKNRVYRNSPEYKDIIDIRRFFWSFCTLLCSRKHLRVGLVCWGLAGECIGRAGGFPAVRMHIHAQCSC